MSRAGWAGAVLWALLLVGGTYVIARRGRAVEDASVPAPPDGPPCVSPTGRDTAALLPWAARRRLVRNHRVRAGDLAPLAALPDSAFPRGHLRCTLAAGARPARGDVVGEPVVVAPRGHAPWVLSLRDQPALVELLDVGDRVDVWRRGAPLATDAPVLAVWCRPGSDAPCAAVVLVSDATWGRLAAPDTAALRILPRRLR